MIFFTSTYPVLTEPTDTAYEHSRASPSARSNLHLRDAYMYFFTGPRMYFLIHSYLAAYVTSFGTAPVPSRPLCWRTRLLLPSCSPSTPSVSFTCLPLPCTSSTPPCRRVFCVRRASVMALVASALAARARIFLAFSHPSSSILSCFLTFLLSMASCCAYFLLSLLLYPLWCTPCVWSHPHPF